MSTAHQGRVRRIAGRHFGKIAVTLALAATAAAISAPGASASVPADGGTPCVYQTFETSTTYESCVGALQVLLNDMHNAGLHGPDRILKTDGIYGNNTYNDVKATNTYCYQNDWGLCKGGSGYTTPNTWKYVCGSLFSHGLYRGSTYYYAANCDVIYPTASGAPAPPQPSKQTGSSAPRQQTGSTAPRQQIGSTAPRERIGSIPCPRTGPVPQPAGSGPPPGSGPRPGLLIRHASWEYEREPNSPRCGWTLHVTPTLKARVGGALLAIKGWKELLRDYRNVAHGIKRNVQGMMWQYECHAAIVSIIKPSKPTWNLDEWRPNVGPLATVRASCNPSPPKERLGKTRH